MAESRFSWDFVTGVSSLLFGVDVVDKDVVWAAGQDKAAVVLTVDRGRSWMDVTPPGIVDALQFHDVEAFDQRRALVLAVGQGPLSKIFRTTDGGATWRVVFDNPEELAFYDGIAFFNSRRGLAFSDPVGDKFRILTTTTGGRTWTVAPTDHMPRVENNEAAHATGTSLVAIGPDDAWFGTAPTAGSNSRVFHTRDGGRSWTAATVPIPVEDKDEFGVVSLVFWDRRNGMAMGGGLLPDPSEPPKPSITAVTHDGGQTWTPAGRLSGFRLNAARIPPNTAKTAVAVGPTGSDITTDGGQTWHQFDQSNLRGVNCSPQGSCWAVGANSTAVRLAIRRR
jgi:photosystem II stability/assembly factor-like uncharacterized protein